MRFTHYCLFFLHSRGRRFKENVVGLAYKSAMCYGRYSVGIVQDGRFSISGVGGTAAHELGHILGMSHDDFEGSELIPTHYGQLLELYCM